VTGSETKHPQPGEPSSAPGPSIMRKRTLAISLVALGVGTLGWNSLFWEEECRKEDGTAGIAAAEASRAEGTEARSAPEECRRSRGRWGRWWSSSSDTSDSSHASASHGGFGATGAAHAGGGS